jgi:hypothetical protein
MIHRYSLIPLTIFYSSLTKLFLLFLLSIWRPNPNETPERPHPHSWNGTLYNNVIISNALRILDEDKLDREWVARNVLGGMAAGFGLRGAYIRVHLPSTLIDHLNSNSGLPSDIHNHDHPRRMGRQDCRG